MIAAAIEVGDYHSSVRHDCRGNGRAELARTLAGLAHFPNETAIGTYQENPMGLEQQAVENAGARATAAAHTVAPGPARTAESGM